MSAIRLSQHPHGYVAPDRMPILRLDDAIRLRPRLRCGTCKGSLWIDPPTWLPGHLYCSRCGREYNEIETGRTAQPSVVEPDRPRRGRPPKVVTA